MHYLCTEQNGSPLTLVKSSREQLMDRLPDGSSPGGDPNMIDFNLNKFKGEQITQANRVLKKMVTSNDSSSTMIIVSR